METNNNRLDESQLVVSTVYYKYLLIYFTESLHLLALIGTTNKVFGNRFSHLHSTHIHPNNFLANFVLSDNFQSPVAIPLGAPASVERLLWAGGAGGLQPAAGGGGGEGAGGAGEGGEGGGPGGAQCQGGGGQEAGWLAGQGW